MRTGDSTLKDSTRVSIVRPYIGTYDASSRPACGADFLLGELNHSLTSRSSISKLLLLRICMT